MPASALPRSDAPRRPRTGGRTTRDGITYGVFVGALVAVSVGTGEPQLHLVVASLLALYLLSAAWGAYNVRQVSVRRLLPDEAFARRPASGLLEVRCTSRWLGAYDLVIEERTGGRARTLCPALGPGARRALPVSWRLPRRGDAVLSVVRVRSTFPFRLVERWVDLPVEDRITVFPEPAEAVALTAGEGPRPGARDRAPDELEELRDYRPGDALRDVHWPTSARVGRPVVAVRRGHRAEPVWAEVPEASGEALEEAVRRATATVIDAAATGRPVGLKTPEGWHPPRVGPGWRRRLLTVLAHCGEDG